MKHWLLTRIVRLPPFKGKHRIVQLARSFSSSPYQCRVSNGLLMELDCYEWAQLYLAQFGTTEPLTMRLITGLLNPGETFVDVGAHVGYVSLVARLAVGESGLVVAIEPQPYNCERLLRNWELNGFVNLRLHVAAAGENVGFVKLPQQTRTDKSRLSLVLAMPDALPLEYEVPLTNLDTILESNNITAVSVLKIDVEGFEESVLRGATKHLGIVRNIVFEALGSEDGTFDNTLEICAWLASQGYRVATVTGEDWNGSEEIPENNLWASKE